jgi:hypothetical protein
VLGKGVWRMRRWLAGLMLVALLLPGATLPLEVFAHEMRHVLDGHHGNHAHHHDHGDYSGIPGSPTHPVDHNCFECQVLMHLARCVPACATPTFVAPLVASLASEPVVPLPPPENHVVPSPPIRGPPRLIA